MPRWCITLLAVACCVLRAALLAVCFGCYPCASPRIGVASVCAVRRFRIVRRVVFVVVHEGGALSAGDYLRVGCCAGGGGGHLAPGRCDATGGLYRPVRSTPCGARLANGACGVVHPAGLEPACPWATPFEGVVYPGSTTDACSPRLLVKGTDCAGVILACLRGWRSRSLVPVLGTSPLDGQSPHRAMFAYPCSGKTTLGRLVGCM